MFVLCSGNVSKKTLCIFGLVTVFLIVHAFYAFYPSFKISISIVLYTSTKEPETTIVTTLELNTTLANISTRHPDKEDIFSMINPFHCPNQGEHLQLVIMIPTTPSRQGARLAIRYTWGQVASRDDVSMYFIIGQAENLTVQTNIEEEQFLFDDIMQTQFIDTYTNLTLKTLSIIKWVKDYCLLANYLLKVDDDVFVNGDRLLQFIARHTPATRTIYGNLNTDTEPIRDLQLKQYIPFEEYNARVFPDYVSGSAYLLPAGLSAEIYQSSLKRKIIRLEDVFLTDSYAELDVSYICLLLFPK
ncbi:beta-1,3-galactosyltransferase 1-like [Photinus pyralis]|nr:beta-1,3-galactosyltransferase 1-like [Photinus pyralis]